MTDFTQWCWISLHPLDDFYLGYVQFLWRVYLSTTSPRFIDHALEELRLFGQIP